MELEDWLQGNPNPGTKPKRKKRKHKKKNPLIYILPVIILAIFLINSMSTAELYKSINKGRTVAEEETDVVELGQAAVRSNLSKQETKEYIKDNYDGYPSYYIVNKVMGNLKVNYSESACGRANDYAMEGYGRGGIKNMLEEDGFTTEEVDYAMKHISNP